MPTSAISSETSYPSWKCPYHVICFERCNTKQYSPNTPTWCAAWLTWIHDWQGRCSCTVSESANNRILCCLCPPQCSYVPGAILTLKLTHGHVAAREGNGRQQWCQPQTFQFVRRYAEWVKYPDPGSVHIMAVGMVRTKVLGSKLRLSTIWSKPSKGSTECARRHRRHDMTKDPNKTSGNT